MCRFYILPNLAACLLLFFFFIPSPSLETPVMCTWGLLHLHSSQTLFIKAPQCSMLKKQLGSAFVLHILDLLLSPGVWYFMSYESCEIILISWVSFSFQYLCSTSSAMLFRQAAFQDRKRYMLISCPYFLKAAWQLRVGKEESKTKWRV